MVDASCPLDRPSPGGRNAPSGGASCLWWPLAIEQKHRDQAIALAETSGATRLILFGSALRHPDQARDLDLACDGVTGWKLSELGARLEEALQVPLALVPLTPPPRLTRLIERRGKVLL